MRAKMKSKTFIGVLIAALIVTVFISDFTADISERLIKEGYWHFGGKSTVTITSNDSGVPIADYGYVNGVYIGKQRNPVTVSQKALWYYENYEAGNEEDKQLFLNCADWLVTNAVLHGDYALLEYTFYWSYGNMTPPWRSGMV